MVSGPIAIHTRCGRITGSDAMRSIGVFFLVVFSERPSTTSNGMIYLLVEVPLLDGASTGAFQCHEGRMRVRIWTSLRVATSAGATCSATMQRW